MKLMRCAGGYSVPETMRRVRVRKILLSPAAAGTTASVIHLTARNQVMAKYPTEFYAKDTPASGVVTTLPYNFMDNPLVFDNGIRAETLTNLGVGPPTALTNGVQIYVD